LTVYDFRLTICPWFVNRVFAIRCPVDSIKYRVSSIETSSCFRVLVIIFFYKFRTTNYELNPLCGFQSFAQTVLKKAVQNLFIFAQNAGISYNFRKFLRISEYFFHRICPLPAYMVEIFSLKIRLFSNFSCIGEP